MGSAVKMQEIDEDAPPCWDGEEEESDTEEEEDLDDLDTRRRVAWARENIEDPRRVGDKQRAQFLARVYVQPPEVLRVIDIEATCSQGHVILLEYQNAHVSAYGYSAISHTYGMEVYSIFDCQCACIFSSSNASIPSRCWGRPCPHDVPGDCKDLRDRVINDILRMCDILSKAGVAYAWHDGVCIAQHDAKEVRATIQSMGWIYSTANETIVFLHYVGQPMAPISPRGSDYDLVCRWHTRVWTLQEAALSKKRRYCVRVCNPPLRFCPWYRSCRTLKKLVGKMKEFEQTVALWYSVDSSEVDVITEERFIVDYIEEAEAVAWQLRQTAQRLKENHSLWSVSNDALGLEGWYTCIRSWYSCLTRLKATLRLTCLGFPTLGAALADCSRRNSKHMGDRINSVLTLAGVKDFVAPKDFDFLEVDGTMEIWTIDFLKQQGQGRLAWALFSINVGIEIAESDIQNNATYTWAPLLWRPLREPDIVGISECSKSWGIEFNVCEDKRLQLKGELVCIAMTLTLKLNKDKRISTAEHDAEEGSFGDIYVDEDLLTSELHVLEDKSYETYTRDKCVEKETDDEMCVDEADFDELYIADKYEGEEADLLTNEMHGEEVNSDETCSDQQVSELEDHESEQDEEIDDEELEEVAQHVKSRESLALELNISVEGFINSFLVRFLDTNFCLGDATFFPIQRNEEGDICRVGGREIKEGDSFDAYLLAPLHYDQKVECLIVQGNLGECVSKIGIFNMFTKLTKVFQAEAGKAIDHPAYKVVKELVID